MYIQKDRKLFLLIFSSKEKKNWFSYTLANIFSIKCPENPMLKNGAGKTPVLVCLKDLD